MAGVQFWVGVVLVFFFKQKTAYEMRISDWSSDVCSSDLLGQAQKLLGTFLTDHREAISEEVNSDWRKAKAWMEQQVSRLQSTDLPLYKEQAKEAYKASQDTFRQDVALALHANLKSSEERRVGKECVSTCISRGEREHKKK